MEYIEPQQAFVQLIIEWGNFGSFPPGFKLRIVSKVEVPLDSLKTVPAGSFSDKFDS